MTVTSGWRSAEFQQSLFDRAVTRWGSAAEARKWVLPPELSAHVKGKAVDVGPTDGAYWMQQHGREFGLCQIYANEIWHYELAVDDAGHCPELLPDAESAQP